MIHIRGLYVIIVHTTIACHISIYLGNTFRYHLFPYHIFQDGVLRGIACTLPVGYYVIVFVCCGGEGGCWQKSVCRGGRPPHSAAHHWAIEPPPIIGRNASSELKLITTWLFLIDSHRLSSHQRKWTAGVGQAGGRMNQGNMLMYWGRCENTIIYLKFM